MERLQFDPERMGEQAQRLRGASAEAGAVLEGLSSIPGLLRGQLGDSALPGALSALLRQGEERARALSGLADTLERAAEIYRGAERTLTQQAGQLPGAPRTGGAAGGSGTIPMGVPTGPAQFGDFLVDDWLARLVLEEEQKGGVTRIASGENGGGNPLYGGKTGALEEAWDWVKEDHALWEKSVSGSALGGVAVGSAGISGLFYSSNFNLGGEDSQTTNQSFDGSNRESEEGISLGVGAGGSAGLLHVEAEGRVGGEYVGVYGEAAGDLGVITAGGTAGVFVDDEGTFVGAQGELGAYAAQGEVTGGLDLGFMKIGGTLEGSVGAGVSGEIGYDDGTFKIGGSAALGLGGGFSLSIDLSPTIDWLTSLF